MRCWPWRTACSSFNFGASIAEGEPRAVMDDPEVQRVYMGMEA